ncbi:cholesterol oxidase [Knoellia sinensis KCTC 19936]|uniref:Cholesterol oxidase n=1 Tax=Knoellia sinensis KCTC 19936 TaxID=1385520 RepID=A0A0A0JA03_9MICO|nr:GMC family oxidoreductase [Knoellia sinensis]KGN32872.1 cholesterol oxidase [Knoellia sinensis KCTC 19936]
MTPTPPDVEGDVDVDVVVIGTGFGGSVAALRLAEKGYTVHMLEAGRRFEDEDFAKTSWDLKNFLWAPALGMFGIQRLHMLPDVMIMAGAGVGGGSLNYANTLYVPPEPFFRDPQWGHITDWSSELAPHYETASAMLGVVENPCEGPVEQIWRDTAADMGVPETFHKTPVGVFFGEPGVEIEDPYFGGAGPKRTGCVECGNCMVGCRYGAKNTLRKNYLHLAEGLGVVIQPMRTVTRLGVVPGADGERTAYAKGSAGSDNRVYRVLHERTGPVAGKDPRVITARHVVVAAGTWGTQTLLHAMREEGELPEMSDRLGHLTRTNSEAILGAVTQNVSESAALSEGLAITSSFHPDEDTHVENVRYGRGSNAMGLLQTLMVPGGTGRPRPVQFLAELVRSPEAVVRILPKLAHRWSERAIIGLVMQTRDNSLRVSGRRGWLGRRGLTSTQGHGEPNPTYIEAGHEALKAVAKRLGDLSGEYTVAGGTWSEVFDIPLTAHFLGGVAISDSPETGVIDPYHRVWGYPGISVVDGSAVSANLGVNPSLTITAQSERAMSLWPNRGEADPRPRQGAAYERLEPVAARNPAAPEVRTLSNSGVDLGMPALRTV